MPNRFIAYKTLAFSSLMTLLIGCGASPKSTLETYLKSAPSSNSTYKLICEKKYVSEDEFKSYYLSPLHSNNEKWKTNSIREVERVDNRVYLEAEHTFKGKINTPEYVVLNRKNGEPCVSWTYNGRYTSSAARLVRYPADKITIWAKVELSDYYNYDFSDRQRTHMSLKILSGNDSWDWKNVYVPYDGNEELYDYLSAVTTGTVKMVVSREYSVDLDSNKVNELNQALYNLSETINTSTGSEQTYVPNYLGYKRSFITDDESILFAPTAVPVILK